MHDDERPRNDGESDEWAINGLPAMPTTHGTERVANDESSVQPTAMPTVHGYRSQHDRAAMSSDARAIPYVERDQRTPPISFPLLFDLMDKIPLVLG